MLRRVAAAAACCGLAAFAIPGAASARPATIPVVATGAGYVEASARTITTTIKIPALAATATGVNAIWIGLQGQGGAGLVQVGFEELPLSPVNAYYPVYAECPTLNYQGTNCDPYFFGPSLNPGDTVKFGVAPLPGKKGYRVSVWDETTGQATWEVDGAYPHMARTAGVWFAELPAGANWLADFGTVTFAHAWPAFRPIRFDEMLAKCMTTPGRMTVVWRSQYCGV